MEHHEEIVSRNAPRWAWDIIDEALGAGQVNSARYYALRSMVHASEEPDLVWMLRPTMGAERRAPDHWAGNSYAVYDWRSEVAADETRLGYREWVQSSLEPRESRPAHRARTREQ